MNTAAITGNVATVPHFRVQGFVSTTTFDVRVDFARRRYTFHVRAMNNVAETSRHLRPGDPVAITGYLHADPHDMADGSLWQRIEIVAYEIEGRPFTNANRTDEELIL